MQPAPYKGAHGGRGSGKSHFFAELLVEDCLRNPGLRAVCIREVQKDLKHSAMQLVKDKISAMGVTSLFDEKVAEIGTPGGGVILFQGMQDHTADSIKSLEGMDRAWVEEGQTLSETSWRMLRPTIRKEGSEIWASWNPRFEKDPIDKFFRTDKHEPGQVICVQANWRDNPWFPPKLAKDRADDLENDPESVPNVWDGDYVTILKGAYYAECLKTALRDGRIGFVAKDPLLTVWTFHDIGGTGAKSDRYSIWAVQFIGREIRVVDHYVSQGQPMAEHVRWMNDRRYKKVVLPHDGVNPDIIIGKRYADHWSEAGFDVEEPYRGYGGGMVGAASQRVEAVRRLFPRIWFNEATTVEGRKALGWYHANISKEGTDLGPMHDWSSNDADSFGLMCVYYEEPRKHVEKLDLPVLGVV